MNKNKLIKHFSPAVVFFLSIIAIKVSNTFSKKTNQRFLNSEQQYAQVSEVRQIERVRFFGNETEIPLFNSGYLRGSGKGGVRTASTTTDSTTTDSTSRITSSSARASSSLDRPLIAEHFATGGKQLLRLH